MKWSLRYMRWLIVKLININFQKNTRSYYLKEHILKKDFGREWGDRQPDNWKNEEEKENKIGKMERRKRKKNLNLFNLNCKFPSTLGLYRQVLIEISNRPVQFMEVDSSLNKAVASHINFRSSCANQRYQNRSCMSSRIKGERNVQNTLARLGMINVKMFFLTSLPSFNDTFLIMGNLWNNIWCRAQYLPILKCSTVLARCFRRMIWDNLSRSFNYIM